jgi:OmpA-OmpF porin, OOP family
MRSKKLLVAGVLGAAATLAAPAAFAQARMSQADTAWYAGGSFGQSEGKCDIAGCDEKDTAWKIFGGYQIDRTWSVELGYSNLGEISAPGLKVETTAWDLVGVGTFPLANQFSFYGKLGLYRGEMDVSSTLPGGSGSGTSTGLTFAVGVQYDFTRNVGVRAEWQGYNKVEAPNSAITGETNLDVLSVGVVYKF